MMLSSPVFKQKHRPHFLNRTWPFNKLIFNYLDIKAKQGKGSDRHGSPSSLLHLVHLYCFCLSCF